MSIVSHKLLTSLFYVKTHFLTKYGRKKTDTNFCITCVHREQNRQKSLFHHVRILVRVESKQHKYTNCLVNKKEMHSIEKRNEKGM